MAQKLSAETYQEEIAKADQELKELQKELVDTLQINDDLAKNIEEKVFILNNYRLEIKLTLSALHADKP